MTAEDAKLILHAHRADDRYHADDPLFAEALALAGCDLALGQWLAREHQLDAILADKLDGITPPVGLRESILVGARASRLGRPWWRRPAVLAFAAGFAVLLVVGGTLSRHNEPDTPAATLAEFSLDQLAFARHSHPRGEGVTALGSMLSARTEPLRHGLGLDCAELARRGCQELDFGGRRVYEVCFRRQDVWYHLYVTARDHGSAPSVDAPQIIERNGLVAATWTEGATMFALATTAGREALTRVL